MHPSHFTADVGVKFHRDGSVRSFPGNTILCNVDPVADAKVHEAAAWAQVQLQEISCAAKMAFLPPDSFHMTVMDLVCDQVRQPERWSKHLPLSAPLDEVDAFFIEQVEKVRAPDDLRMRFVRMRAPGVVIALEPADPTTALELAWFRERIAAVTGVRFPGHDSYGFHISLAYILIHLDEAEQAELAATLARIEQELSKTFGLFAPTAPQLAFFDDMFKFVPAAQRLQLKTR